MRICRHYKLSEIILNISAATVLSLDERHKYYLGVNCNLTSKAQECSSNVLQYQITKQVYSLTKHLSVTSLFRLTDSSSDIRYQVTFT